MAGPRKLPGFKRSTCPERMGSLHQRGGWGSQGKYQGCVPLPGSLPQEGFPGAKGRAQARAGQRDIPKSHRSIPTPLPSFISSKEVRKMCLLLTSSSQRERDKEKKRQLCDGFGNQLKQKGKVTPPKKEKKRRKKWVQCAKGRVSPNIPILGKIKCYMKSEALAEAAGGWSGAPGSARRAPGSVPPAALRSYRQRPPRHGHGVTGEHTEGGGSRRKKMKSEQTAAKSGRGATRGGGARAPPAPAAPSERPCPPSPPGSQRLLFKHRTDKIALLAST